MVYVCGCSVIPIGIIEVPDTRFNRCLKMRMTPEVAAICLKAHRHQAIFSKICSLEFLWSENMARTWFICHVHTYRNPYIFWRISNMAVIWRYQYGLVFRGYLQCTDRKRYLCNVLTANDILWKLNHIDNAHNTKQHMHKTFRKWWFSHPKLLAPDCNAI